jgi:hypothetical protein
MKKLLSISNGQHLFLRIGRTVLVLLVGVGLGITFWTATSAVAQTSASTMSGTTAAGADKPSPTPKPPKPSPTPKPPKPSPTPKPGKCTICDHDKGKDTEQQIDCDKVDKFLADHPQDTRGACVPTPVTNP